MDHPLQVILNPRSVVIAGASNNFMKMGTVQALSLLNQGFAGEVSFLHPTEPEVLRAADIVLDRGSRSVQAGGQAVDWIM